MENLDQWIDILKSLDFFALFDDDEFAELMVFCNIKKYDLNDYEVNANDQGDSFYVILKGFAFVILKDARNVKRQVGKLVAGDCFGEVAILLNQPRSASIRVGSDAYIFHMSHASVDKCTKDTQTKIYRSFGVMLSRRLITTSSYLP